MQLKSTTDLDHHRVFRDNVSSHDENMLLFRLTTRNQHATGYQPALLLNTVSSQLGTNTNFAVEACRRAPASAIAIKHHTKKR